MELTLKCIWDQNSFQVFATSTWVNVNFKYVYALIT